MIIYDLSQNLWLSIKYPISDDPRFEPKSVWPPKLILQFPKQLHKKKENIKWEQSSLSWSPLRRLRYWFLKCYSSIHKSTSQQPHNAAILKQNVGNIFHIKGDTGFPGGSGSRESACNVGALGSIPGLGRSPGEGNSNPLQYCWLVNTMDRETWWATVYGVAKHWIQLNN